MKLDSRQGNTIVIRLQLTQSGRLGGNWVDGLIIYRRAIGFFESRQYIVRINTNGNNLYEHDKVNS